MCLDRASLLAILLISFVPVLFGQVAFAQQKSSQTKILAELDRAVDRGGPDDERRISDFAVANPSNPKALELLARFRLRQGRLAESRALFQRVLELDPGSTTAKINSSRVSVMLGQKEEAAQTLISINNADSLAPPLKLDLATALMLVGEAQRSLELAETLPVNIKNSTALPLLGTLYLVSGRSAQFTELIPLMKKAAMTDVALAIACADVLRNAGQYKEAIAVLSSVRNLQTDPRVLISLSRLETLARDFDHAREHLKRASVLDPDSAGVLSAQAFLESSNGDLAAAFKSISRARELAPNSNGVLADFVVVAMRYNKPGLAVDAAKTLSALDPTNVEFRYLYGAASLQSGDLDTAQQLLEGYVKERPLDSKGCLALGMTYAGRPEQIDKARQQLSHCIDVDPSDGEAKYQLALSYKSQGENKQAIALLESTLQQDRNNPLAMRDLGTLYFETGEASKARPLLEKAVELNPKDADTHFQLARVYSQLGESELAKKQQEMFRQLRGPWGKASQ
jgi:Tfp pilus assembly protein PilF